MNAAVEIVRPDAPRDTGAHDVQYHQLTGPELRDMLLWEIRRKITREIEDLRAYAFDSHSDEVRRVFTDTADRLDDIIGAAPV